MRTQFGAALVSCLALGFADGALPSSDPAPNMGAPMAEGDSMPIAGGNLSGLAHESSGKVTILQTKDGSRILRFEDLKTSNGPDLRVYLVEGTDATKDEVIKAGKFVDLGALKGNVGNQNYAIPKDVQLERYQSVSIWCRRFGVNFAAARLTPAASGSGR